jgi:hypothetical protein
LTDAFTVESIQMSLCSICYSAFEGKGRTTLDCGHEYHLRCIVQWFSQKGGRSCALCRKPPTENECIWTDSSVNDITPLMLAVSDNDADQVARFIQAGHDVNAVDSEGNPALVYSVRNHYETITRRLLDAGADLTQIGKLVDVHTLDGALSAACTFYSPSCLTRALSMCVSAEGVTRAYDIAVSKGYMDLAYLLHIKRDVLTRRFRIV